VFEGRNQVGTACVLAVHTWEQDGIAVTARSYLQQHMAEQAGGELPVGQAKVCLFCNTSHSICGVGVPGIDHAPAAMVL
jgi:hypothetical protein